ncbi:MAG: sulfotransferase family 2 domain-containing protein [Halieaceae bacterium]|jgi:hypothetical protein|nr:sulfotransferase family 2 domain-containing protein [Halieaceae bacterium]
MPICHKNKFIYLHIPRCGGTSIETYFKLFKRSNCYGVVEESEKVIVLHHLTGQGLLKSGRMNRSTYDDYFKFTIIRDPFLRLASDYIWQKKHDRHRIFRELSFSQFVSKAEEIVKERAYHQKQHFEHFRPMVEYCFHHGELMVDDILLLENLIDGMRRISRHTGPVDLPRLNTSGSYKELDNRRNRDLVYHLYSADKVLYDKIATLKTPTETIRHAL